MMKTKPIKLRYTSQDLKDADKMLAEDFAGQLAAVFLLVLLMVGSVVGIACWATGGI
jgi:hypothetical protein